MSRKKVILWSLGGLSALALTAALLAPRALVQEATRPPSETEAGTFVTRQTTQVSLQDRLQQSLSNPSESSDNQKSTTTITIESGGGRQAQIQGTPSEALGTEPNQSPQDEVIWRSEPAQNQQTDSSAPNEPQREQTQVPETRQQNVQPTQTQAEIQHRPRSQTQQPSSFQVHMTEAEVSNLVYTGLHQGIEPQFRSALQGVSTRIQGGRARVTVALLPKHLPEAFLKNLPGVTRNTPTVYLGGEMSLQREGHAVVPEIHHISLGSFKVPIPFIQSAVRAQVQAYSTQLLQLPDGRQARLQDVQLDQGRITLSGQVD